MSGQSKEWVKLQLGNACKSLYNLRLNEKNEVLTPEGCLLKWTIRDSKVKEPWDYSLTIAMSLASPLKRPAETIAEELARYLSEHSSDAWHFVHLNGYVNAYFQPTCLKDFMSGKETLDWSVLYGLQNGAYANYRLKVLLSSLEARGAGGSPESLLEVPLKGQRLSSLFNYPEKSPKSEERLLTAWELWLEEIVQITRAGLLRDLDRETEEVLYAFIKACLS